MKDNTVFIYVVEEDEKGKAEGSGEGGKEEGRGLQDDNDVIAALKKMGERGWRDYFFVLICITDKYMEETTQPAGNAEKKRNRLTKKNQGGCSVS
jgi:hypothetical protein